jgi:hypothetical protein
MNAYVLLNLVLVLNTPMMHLMLPFFLFKHLHLASHLGTLDVPREGYGVEAKPEDGVWWDYPEDGSIRRVVSDKHQLSVGSQASPGAL